MLDQATIREAAHALLRAAPGSRVILFGSHARGDAGPNSDLDFLVVEPRVESTLDEYVRLRLAVRPLPVPVDILVTSRADFERWSSVPSSIYYQAAREGRIFDATD